VTESFLHYLWQFQYFDKRMLQTTTGDEIQIFHPGFRNNDAGPDFFDARIKIGEMEWVGSVEIHIHAAGWMEHQHDQDMAYENVILHVVWNNNKPVKRNDGSWLPTLELKHRVDEELLLNYKRLVHNPEPIPCSSKLNQVSQLLKYSMADKVLIDRLESKARVITVMLQRNQYDWEETFYQLLSRNFGFKVNNEPFQQLAQSIPYKFLLKHGDKFQQVEAMLFGQAGFLDDDHDEPYYAKLKREYRMLSHKYQLSQKKLNKVQWRFLRLRPANFPTVRLAQLTAILFHRKNLFSSILEINSSKDLYVFFSVKLPEYWIRHYQFGKVYKDQKNSLGRESIDNIIINVIAPALVAYGKSKDDQMFVDRAVRILQAIPAESNRIIRQWKMLGMEVKTGFDSQAMVELFNNFCLKRRCLDCNIGTSLVNPTLK
jgi:Protein of unknown function (DUF2851)